MDPVGPLIALLAMQQAAPALHELVAYAIPSAGLVVVVLPDGHRMVLGNTFAAEVDASNQLIVQLRWGSQPDAVAALPKLTDPTSYPREYALAQHVTAGGGYLVKYKSNVWVFDRSRLLASVDKGHFLGKSLQGSDAENSMFISQLLQLGAGLDPLQSAIVGARHYRAVHHGRGPIVLTPHGYHKAKRVIHFCTF